MKATRSKIGSRLWLLFGLVLLSILSCNFVCVYASETLQVSPESEITRTMRLATGDNVTGNLSVVLFQSDNGTFLTAIDFYVTDPGGNAILQYNLTLGDTFSFIAGSDGTYTLHFRDSTDYPAEVTFDYSVRSARLAFYLILIVVAAALAVILALVVLRRRKKPSPPSPT